LGADHPIVIIIGAESGVGKSALTKQVISLVGRSISSIRVSTAQVNRASATDAGSFLREVFVELCRANKEESKLAFQKYVTGIKDPIVRRRTLQAVFNLVGDGSAKAAPFRLLVVVLKRVFRLSEFDYEHFANSSFDSSTIRIMNEYISFVLAKIRHLVCIDGLQNIDSKSQECLMQWIRDSVKQKGVFLLEYTVEANDSETAIQEFRDMIAERCGNVETIKLDWMTTEHAIQAARPKGFDNINDDGAGEFYKKNAGGNIRKLRDYYSIQRFKIDECEASPGGDPTGSLISALSQKTLIVFSIIRLHKGRIDKVRLREIASGTLSDLEIKDCVHSMMREEFDFLIDNGSQYWVTHPSCLDSLVIAEAAHKALFYTALKLTIDYYEPLITSSISDKMKEEAALILLDLFCEYDKQRLPRLLPTIGPLLISGICPSRATDYLNSIIEVVRPKKEQFPDVYFTIIGLCLDLEYIDIAASYLAELEEAFSHTKTFIFHRCTLFVAAEEYSEAIDYIDTVFEENAQTLLGSYLVLFRILSLKLQYRSFDTTELLAVAETRALMHNSSAFTGFLRRISEISSPRNLAVADLKQSILCFSNAGFLNQAAKSELSLGFLYAIRGDFHLAFSCYQLAEKVLYESEALYRHIFCVNSAAIFLLQGNYTKDVWRLLDEAELTARTTTSKIAIQINKLAYCLETKEHTTGEYVATLLRELTERRVDSQFKALAFYNLHLHYSEVGNCHQSGIMLKKADGLKEECSSLRSRLSGEVLTDGTSVLLEHSWHVCFLSSINIDCLESEESLSERVQLEP